MRMMGITADCFGKKETWLFCATLVRTCSCFFFPGNHNFDKGLAHAKRMTEAAHSRSLPGRPFHFIASNFAEPERSRLLPLVKDFEIFRVGPLRVGVVGITSPRAPLTAPAGAFGALRILDPVREAMRAQRAARRAGADIVICLVHMGFSWSGESEELIAFARNVSGFALIKGDHTNIQKTQIINGQRVVESLSFSNSYARVQLVIDRRNHSVINSTNDFVVPDTRLVVPDAKILLKLDEFREKLRPLLGHIIAQSPTLLPLTDSCGDTSGRSCESQLGNLLADSFRLFNLTGIDFGFMNNGAMRFALTCDKPGTGAFCPANATRRAPFPITRGAIRQVIPFDGTLVTVTVNGTMLRDILEATLALKVSSGARLHISGGCYTWNSDKPAKSRLVRFVRIGADGRCSGPEVALTPQANYTITLTNAVAEGLNGVPVLTHLPNYRTRMTPQEQIAGYLESLRPFVAPAIVGRITCVGNNCPKKA